MIRTYVPPAKRKPFLSEKWTPNSFTDIRFV